MPLPRRTILHNLTALAASQLAARTIRFLYLVAIARFLDAREVGLFSYGMAFYLSLAVLSIFGQDTLLATRIGRKRFQFAVVAAHSLTILAAAIAVTAGLGLGFLWSTESDPQVARALGFFMLALMARGLAVWVRSCYVALEKATWIPRYELVFRGLEALTGVVVLWLGAGLLAICFLHFAYWALEAVLSFRRLKLETGVGLRLGVGGRLLRNYALAAAPVTLGIWLLLLFPQIGIVGLRHMQSDIAQVANFAIAMQFVTTLFVLPVSLGQAILPGLTRAQRSRNAADLLALATVLKFCLVGGAVVAALAGPIGPWLIPLLFGARYLAAGEAFGSLMWGLGPLSAAFIAVSALNGLGARGPAARAAFTMVAIQVAGMLALGEYAGMDAMNATIAAFLAASLAGMALSAVALTSALQSGGGFENGQASVPLGWWPRPTAILIVCAVIGLSHWLSPHWAAFAGMAAALAGTMALGVFSRHELAALLVKAGFRSVS